jgi:methylthioribose-1-phosphate isomerase
MAHIEWQRPCLVLLDQRKLPHTKEYVSCETHFDVAIGHYRYGGKGSPRHRRCRRLRDGYGCCPVQRAKRGQQRELLIHLEKAARHLQNARPTAVNLAWAVDRMLAKAREERERHASRHRRAMLCAEAERIAAEDKEINRSIGRNGAPLLPAAARVLTYCNAGALATVDYGTALGVIRWAHSLGKIAGVCL